VALAAAAAGAVILAACAGPVGKGEGEACSKDECSSNLTCQPIVDSSNTSKGDFCCPTPPGSSNYANCRVGQ
jgi:hypothetical protein